MITCDVVVIGAGVIGAATARALAGAGRDVVLLERFEVGHAHGSSHGSARIFRLSYADEEYVRMGREALELWHVLEAEAGERLLHPAPAINAGGGLDELAEALGRARVPFSVMSGVEAAGGFAGVSSALGERVVVEHGAAVIAAERALRGLVASGARAGVVLREGARVREIRQDSDGVSVSIDSGAPVRGRAAVITAGPWVRGILAGTGIDVPVRPTRETVAYHADGGVRTPIVIDRREILTYALPVPGGGIKAGEHVAGPPADPDERGQPDTASSARVAAWLGERFPAAAAHPRAAETCFYTNTEDERFILQAHGRIVVGSACSGHGFKFAPLTGARLAALAQRVL